jgi:hypothetical protein
MATLIDFVEIHEFVVRAFGPASWRLIDFSGKNCHGSRNRDVHGIEVV